MRTIEITDEELRAMKAALYTLRKSRELKYGASFCENVRADQPVLMSFYDAELTLSELIGRIDQQEERADE